MYERPSKRSPNGFVWWGDFRRFASVGGTLEALAPEGAKWATWDEEVARQEYNRRVTHYLAKERGSALGLNRGEELLGEVIAWHLQEKARARKATKSTIERDQQGLKNVLDFYGNVPLKAITTPTLPAYVEHRRRQRGVSTGTNIADATIRNELNSLSNLFRRAMSEHKAASNPVAALMDKPATTKAEAAFLKRADAARLLDGAVVEDNQTREALAWLQLSEEERKSSPRSKDLAVNASRQYPYVEAVLATLLYTGGRSSEVLGLLVQDIDFETRLVHFVRNDYRGLKRGDHNRAVPLEEPLAITLRAYLNATGIERGLLFPSQTGGMMHNFNKQLARAVARADCTAAQSNSQVSPMADAICVHSLRHTFATAALTSCTKTESGTLVQLSEFTVAKLLGHRSAAMIHRTYGHLSLDRATETLTYEPWRTFPASRLAESGAILV